MTFFEFLDSFWNRYVDQEDIERIWDGYVTTVGYLYTHLYEINLSKSIDYVPLEFTNVFELFDLSTPLEVHPASSYAATYPYVYTIDTSIVEIPLMTDDFENPEKLFFTGDDYLVIPNAGYVMFKEEPEPSSLWAADIRVDLTAVRDNFGDLIDFVKENTSFTYLRKVQGIWLALWGGPTIENEEMGLHIMMSAPFAFADGVITEIVYDTDPTSIVGGRITDSNGFIYTWAKYVDLRVEVGDPIEKFSLLSDAIRVEDYIENPYWYKRHYQYPDVPGYTTEYWEIKKHHNFAVWINMEQLWYAVSLESEENELRAALDGVTPEPVDNPLHLAVDFLEKIKPSHTNYLLEVFLDVLDTWEVPEDITKIEIERQQTDHLWDMCLIYNDPRNVLYGGVIQVLIPRYDGLYDYNEPDLLYGDETIVDLTLGYFYPGEGVVTADIGLFADDGMFADMSRIYTSATYPWLYACERERAIMTLDRKMVDGMVIDDGDGLAQRPVEYKDTEMLTLAGDTVRLEIEQRYHYQYNDATHPTVYDGAIMYNDYWNGITTDEVLP